MSLALQNLNQLPSGRSSTALDFVHFRSWNIQKALKMLMATLHWCDGLTSTSLATHRHPLLSKSCHHAILIQTLHSPFRQHVAAAAMPVAPTDHEACRPRMAADSRYETRTAPLTTCASHIHACMPISQALGEQAPLNTMG